MCVCPSPRPQVTSGEILILNDWLNNSVVNLDVFTKPVIGLLIIEY